MTFTANKRGLFFCLIKQGQLGIVVQSYNPSTGDAGAGGSQVSDLPFLKTLSPKKKTNNIKIRQ
jgi:hypothetical protein